MKKFLRKVLALTTLATVVPVRISHDEETGKTTYQSLLATLTLGPGPDGIGTNAAINMGEGVLTEAVQGIITARQEAAMFADEELIVVTPAEETETTPAD